MRSLTAAAGADPAVKAVHRKPRSTGSQIVSAHCSAEHSDSHQALAKFYAILTPEQKDKLGDRWIA